MPNVRIMLAATAMVAAAAAGTSAASAAPCAGGVFFNDGSDTACLTTTGFTGFSLLHIDGTPTASSAPQSFTEVGNFQLNPPLPGSFKNAYFTFEIMGQGSWAASGSGYKFSVPNGTGITSAVIDFFGGSAPSASFSVPTSLADFGVTGAIPSIEFGTATLSDADLASADLTLVPKSGGGFTVSEASLSLDLKYAPTFVVPPIGPFDPAVFAISLSATASDSGNMSATVDGGTDIRFGTEHAVSGTATFTPVSEPASLIILGTALIGLVSVRRKFR